MVMIMMMVIIMMIVMMMIIIMIIITMIMIIITIVIMIIMKIIIIMMIMMIMMIMITVRYDPDMTLTDMRSCYSGLQSEGPPRDEHNSDTKRGVASAMKPPDKKRKRYDPPLHPGTDEGCRDLIIIVVVVV